MAKLDGIIGRMNGDSSREDIRALIEKLGTVMPAKSDDLTNKQLLEFLAEGFRETGNGLDEVVSALDSGASFKEIKGLVGSLDKSLTALSKRLDSLKPDNSDVLKAVAGVQKAVESVEFPEMELDLTPLVDAIEMLAKRKPELSKDALAMLQRDDEEWEFHVEREDFSDRIKTITARKVS